MKKPYIVGERGPEFIVPLPIVPPVTRSNIFMGLALSLVVGMLIIAICVGLSR